MNTIPLDLPKLTPIQIAAKSYLKWKSAIPFEEDFRQYAERFMVVSRPDILIMAKIVMGNKNLPALFVRMAVGQLRPLLLAYPLICPVFLPRIRFSRRNRRGEERVREYDLEKLLNATDKMIKKGQTDVSETM